ncbi:MAG: type II toxin-antitoxin system VapC family toxin [Bryobacterales bacterium]|nr:type II toxin-antitoxin system VapC family toxin [Bryobacterales bacterium]
MTVFVDTSGIFAVMDRDDRRHSDGVRIWNALLDQEAHLWTHNYVLLETSALLQRRLGLAAMRRFNDDAVPMLEVDWVTAELHFRAVESLRFANRRDLSLVDCVSFALMRQRAALPAFGFDSHFEEQGFQLLK